MKFLVFGGTGFVGASLIKYIEKKGGEVFSVSRSKGTKNCFSLDISKKEEFSRINFIPDIIVNCASRIPIKGKSSKDPSFLKELFMTNVVGGVNIANWALENSVSKIINCSTLVVVKKPWPEPLSEEFSCLPEGIHVGYSMSKLSQEQIMNECVKESKTKLLHLRLSAVYGTDMIPEGILFKILYDLQRNNDINLTDAEKNTLDLIHVEDVSRIIWNLAQKEFEHNILNVATGKEVSILNLASTLKDMTKSDSKITNERTDALSSKAKINVAKMHAAMEGGFEPFISLQEGLNDLVEKSCS